MDQRRQAGPLPAKTPTLVGEIGYSQGLHDVDLGDGPAVDTDSMEGLNAAEADARNGRHPADRSPMNLASQSTTSLSLPSSASNLQSLPSHNDSTSSMNTASKRRFFSFRSVSTRFAAKSYGGVTLVTWARLGVFLLSLAGLVIAWVFAAQYIVRVSSEGSPGSSNMGGTSSIFVHVAFAIVLLIFLIFTERAVFQFRAERYAHVHPGEILPSSRHRRRMSMHNGESAGIGFVPWHRPPLPTYAAALGVRGTGDVEDVIIAAPPPPAYGNTRGSTLILANLIRNSRASQSRASAQSRGASWQVVGRPGADGRMSGVSTRSMPISYDEAEHHSDVARARVLEETLARLEDGGNSRMF